MPLVCTCPLFHYQIHIASSELHWKKSRLIEWCLHTRTLLLKLFLIQTSRISWKSQQKESISREYQQWLRIQSLDFFHGKFCTSWYNVQFFLFLQPHQITIFIIFHTLYPTCFTPLDIFACIKYTYWLYKQKHINLMLPKKKKNNKRYGYLRNSTIISMKVYFGFTAGKHYIDHI